MATLTRRQQKKNRDKKETLHQNYSRFGILAKINNVVGSGALAKTTNAKLSKTQRLALIRNGGHSATVSPSDPLAVHPSASPATTATSNVTATARIAEVRVERDASGKILRVIRDEPAPAHNALNDPLNKLDDPAYFAVKDDGKEWGGFEDDGDDGDDDDETRPQVVRELERQASIPGEVTVRYQSDREREWLDRLVAKHGDDTFAMARDHKLNPMQQTKADIARRLKKAGLLKQ